MLTIAALISLELLESVRDPDKVRLGADCRSDFVSNDLTIFEFIALLFLQMHRLAAASNIFFK